MLTVYTLSFYILINLSLFGGADETPAVGVNETLS
jgi:hypothetical protein